MRRRARAEETEATYPGPPPRTMTRRRWLERGLALLAVPGLARVATGQSASRIALRPDEQKLVETIEARAREVGLGPFDASSTEHFLGVGNTPAGYRAEALHLCEMIADDFMRAFRERDFKKVALPARRMTVVVLKDAGDYAAFSKKAQKLEGGRYEIDANRLIVFDFRPEQGELARSATRINTFTLVHETIHLLSFNTGLLSAQADWPTAISEGIATYGELWVTTNRRKAFGMVNRPRLAAIDQAAANRVPWIPVSKLIGDDCVFDDPNPDVVQLAYAESWLLVHMLLRQPAWLPKFRKYLAGMPKPGGKLNRSAYAASVFGPLDRLDQAVRRYEGIVRKRLR